MKMEIWGMVLDLFKKKDEAHKGKFKELKDYVYVDYIDEKIII
jgi:hypothetical protein